LHCLSLVINTTPITRADARITAHLRVSATD
jgi:hypothetical protein